MDNGQSIPSNGQDSKEAWELESMQVGEGNAIGEMRQAFLMYSI